MSIATEITRLRNAKAALKESIEAKGVTVEDTAKLDEYSALVDNIPQGGGGVEEKDVNFYDYDGTCVYSYTKDEFLALNEMPANPDHTNEGLISDGWNCDFDELQAFISKYGKYDVGQTYSPSDGKTRLCVKVTDPSIEMKIYGYETTTDALNIIIDWGDGSPLETYTDTNIHHSYSAIGIYVIIISVTSNIFAFGASNNSNNACVGSFNSRDRINAINLQYVILGNNIKAAQGSFGNCINLKYIIFKTKHIIRNGTNNYFINVFTRSGAPKCLIFDENCTTIAEGIIDEERNLKILCCPLHISNIYKINAYNLKSPINLVDYFKNNRQTQQILLNYILSKDIYIDIENSTITTISRLFLSSCTNVEILHIPKSVTALNSDAIAYTSQYSLKDIYFHSTVPPTITSSSIGNVGCINFYVPAESIEAYKTATNWSNYADKIFPIPTE